jgi:tetratricopeptide (TPR) repeat protein
MRHRHQPGHSPACVALWFCCSLLGAGCAPAVAGPAGPAARDVPRLEARLARDTVDVAAMVSLAAAYRGAGRLDEALGLLERAVARRPNEPGALFMLGLTYEDIGRRADAAAVYDRAARVSRSPRIRAQARGRARVVQREEWIQQARDAVAQEAGIADTPPQPRTVAVLPFHFEGQDADLRPLGRALAELVVTDLAQIERLRVLERMQVQMLIQEARLADQGLVDPATAVRGGRLLGAERIVQGTLAERADALELRAAVVEVAAGRRVAPVEEQDAAGRLFDMQKRLVLGLVRGMGIELTPAELARIDRRPTRNLQALLAFGVGLESEDVGAWALAAEHFRRAASLDPGFAAAGTRAEAAAAAALAERTETRELTGQALAEFGAAAAAFAVVEELVPTAGGRTAASEALGQDFIGSQGAVLRIIIRSRP